MGSSRHPVNPVKLSQLAFSYGFAGLFMFGTIPCSRNASIVIPTDVLYALSSMILLLGPARLCLSWALVSCHEFIAKRALPLSEALCPCSIPNRRF
jgi:hypothetical protein